MKKFPEHLNSKIPQIGEVDFDRRPNANTSDPLSAESLRKGASERVAPRGEAESRIRNLFFGYRKGIALLVALGTMIVILVIGSLAVYLITRGLSIAQGQKQYQSAFEACEGGIEIGIAEVDESFRLGLDSPTNDTFNIGTFKVQVYTQPLFSATVAGAAIKFARGYTGAGQGISQGGVNVYYLVRAQAIGTSGERIAIEIEQKKTIGID